MKSDREILIEEVRSARDTVIRVCQWGITVLLSLQIATYYIRNGLVERLVQSGELSQGALMPLDRYLIGTFFLCFIATIFTILTSWAGKRIGFFSDQLIELDNNNQNPKIKWPKPLRKARWLMRLLFFSFPVVDLLIRVYITIELK